MKQIAKINKNYPIFDACEYANKLIVCGGGGGQKFGIQNKLELLNGNDLKVQNIMNDQFLFQKVQASEENDIIVANTDLSIFIYKQNFDKIQLIKQIDFEEDLLDEIKVYFSQNLLIYQDTKRMVHINQIESDILIDLFQLQMNHEIKNMLIILQHNLIIFYLQEEVLLFCLKTKTFIQKILKPQKAEEKVFLDFQHNKDDQTYLNIIANNKINCQMKILLLQNKNFQLVDQIQLCDSKISAYNRLKNVIVTSTPNGKIQIFNFKQNIVSLVKEIKAHEFPVSKFIIREIIDFQNQGSINLISFGTDSMINSYQINFDQLLKHYYLQQMRKYVIIIVILLAFVFSMFTRLRSNNQEQKLD